MTLNKRQIFLDKFLGLLGAQKIVWATVDTNKVCGTILYFDNDSQDFCWRVNEDSVPSNDTIKLIQVIRDNNFIAIDKLIVSENVLFEKTSWTDRKIFDIALNQLFDVNVRMVEDGEETDSFFIHD